MEIKFDVEVELPLQVFLINYSSSSVISLLGLLNYFGWGILVIESLKGIWLFLDFFLFESLIILFSLECALNLFLPSLVYIF